MKIKLFVSVLALVPLLSGCINQENLNTNTTQGSSAIGAIAGAVIGGNKNNASGTSIATGAVLGALGGGGIGAAIGGSEKQTGGWDN